MSDQSQGYGWWQASDGQWYPPERHPGYLAPAAPTAQCGRCGSVLAASTASTCLTCGARKFQTRSGLQWFDKGERPGMSNARFWSIVLAMGLLAAFVAFLGVRSWNKSVDDGRRSVEECFDNFEVGSPSWEDCMDG